MKIAVGADHRGFEMKGKVLKFLEKRKDSVLDLGTFEPEPPCDYPVIAAKVAEAVAAKKAARGILVCKSGIGMSIAANKVKGIRAALVHDSRSSDLSRRHNDANVLVLSSDELREPLARVLEVWLEAPFDGARHKRRVDQIKALERKHFK